MKADAYRELLEHEVTEQTPMSVALMEDASALGAADPGMGLAPGGRMKQQIYADPHDFDVWDTRVGSRCFVHIANSLAWRAVTGESPPTTPLTSREYNDYGMPWFDYYDGDREALSGANKFADVKSVKQMGDEKGENPLPENESVEPERVVKIEPDANPDRVREGRF